uniref:(northern house mosquito) hypothetical protein n=1 Tax=Culex pipiens TaxID=7175 RepID=A0A8D8HF48_CULPI
MADLPPSIAVFRHLQSLVSFATLLQLVGLGQGRFAALLQEPVDRLQYARFSLLGGLRFRVSLRLERIEAVRPVRLLAQSILFRLRHIFVLFRFHVFLEILLHKPPFGRSFDLLFFELLFQFQAL